MSDDVMAALAAKRAQDDLDALTEHCDRMERACAVIAAAVGCAWDADSVAENERRVVAAIREKCR